MEVALVTVTDVAAVPPNVTAVAPVKFVPVIMTVVPPAIGPLAGLADVTVGTPAYVYTPVPVPLPPGVVTTTFTAPAACAGVVAVMEVALVTVTDVAAVPPNVTAVAPVKFVPVMVTVVPPAIGPLAGLADVTVGTPAYVYTPVPVPLPPGVVTTTSTAPAACAGVVAVMEVALLTVTDVAAVPPNVTAVAPVKFVPVMVTVVPPAIGPLAGLADVTVGTAKDAVIVFEV